MFNVVSILFEILIEVLVSYALYGDWLKSISNNIWVLFEFKYMGWVYTN